MSNNIVIAAIVAGAVGLGAGYALFSGQAPKTVEKETVTVSSAPAGAGTLDEVRARGKLNCIINIGFAASTNKKIKTGDNLCIIIIMNIHSTIMFSHIME